MTPARLAGVCGLLAFVTFNAGWVAGDFAQSAAFSPANDDISYLGAMTASSPWLYNQLAANLSGLLIVVLGVGLWRALSPSRLGRFGAAALIASGIGAFLDGIFRLDCRSIDAGCKNDSWHSHAHKIESGFTVSASFLALVLLAFAFRRVPEWRHSWLPTLLALPAVFVASAVFSTLGDGAGTRAGTVVLFAAFAFMGFRLLQNESRAVSANPGPKSA
jgi:hypothetical membrane protein